MKKLLFTITTILLTNISYSQCSPDLTITSPGIYPDEITNLPEAFVGQPYLAQIDVLTPLDTSVSLSGLNVNVTIDNIELTSVTGLPNNFNYSCNPPSCIFPGGTYACAQLFSTSDPTSADIGYYPITMTTSTLAINIPLIGSLTQVDTVDYYYIDISNTASTMQPINSFTFEVKDVYPNPASSKANFQFVIGKNEIIDFFIINSLGQTVNYKQLQSNFGVNKFELDLSCLSSGLYTYILKTDNRQISKKILITDF